MNYYLLVTHNLNTGEFDTKDVRASSGEDAIKSVYPDPTLVGDFTDLMDQLDERDLPTTLICLDRENQLRGEIQKLSEYIQKGSYLSDHSPQNQKETEDVVYNIADELSRILKKTSL